MPSAGGVEITVCELKDDFLLPNDMSCNVLAETIKFATSDMDNIGLMEDRLIIEKALGEHSFHVIAFLLKNPQNFHDCSYYSSSCYVMFLCINL